jgi:hypothetical protein
VLRFSGGHADDTKVSAITSITYKINGKHSLKCVGKNPRLAEAKSKTDKNITGLLNQVEAGKIVVYNFTNATAFTIGNTATEIMAITFTSKEETTATFLAEVLFEVKNDTVTRTIKGTVPDVDEAGETIVKNVDFTFEDTGESELTVIYKMNDEEVKTFYPKKTCINGKHILTLFLPITQVIENSENTLSVFFKLSGGSLTIGESQIKATISGQGLVAGIGDWNGRISISEVITDVSIVEQTMMVDAFTGSTVVTFPRMPLPRITQQFGRVSISVAEFGYDRLNERVTAVEVIKTFTMDEDFPPNYDKTVVDTDENGAFCMVSEYVYVSAEEEINSGQLQHLSVDTTPFERVESQEVVLC